MKTIREVLPRRVRLTYVCKSCRTRYRNKKNALKCEAMPVEDKFFHVGDLVKWREQYHCDRYNKNYFPKGRVARILGPMLPDEEYNIKWLQSRLSGKHVFQYEVKWTCPYCGNSCGNLFYGMELKQIKNPR